MATAAAKIILDVDAQMAKAGLADAQRQAETLNGRVIQLDKSFAKIGPAGAKVSRAMSGLSQAAGETSSQMSKVVAGAGGVAGAFTAGPMIGAIAAAAIALQSLNKRWDDLIKKMDEAQDRALEPAVKAAAALAKIRRDNADLRSQLAGPDTPQQAMARVAPEIAAAKQEREAAAHALKAIEKQLELARRNVRLAEARQNEAAIERTQEVAQGLELQAESYRAAVTIYGRAADALEEKASLSAMASIKRDVGKPSAQKVDRVLEKKAGPDPAEQQRKIDEQLARQEEEARRREIDALRSFYAEKSKLRELEAAEEQRIMDRRIQSAMMLASASANVADAIGRAGVQAAAGNEQVFENFLSSASHAIGGVVQLYGGELIAKGINSTMSGAIPIGAAQIAAGLGLVAAGGAISETGPAAVARMTGIASGAASDSGVNRRRNERPIVPQQGDGGQVVIIHGHAGPLSDENARMILRDLNIGARRGVR